MYVYIISVVNSISDGMDIHYILDRAIETKSVYVASVLRNTSID